MLNNDTVYRRFVRLIFGPVLKLLTCCNLGLNAANEINFRSLWECAIKVSYRAFRIDKLDTPVGV